MPLLSIISAGAWSPCTVLDIWCWWYSSCIHRQPPVSFFPPIPHNLNVVDLLHLHCQSLRVLSTLPVTRFFPRMSRHVTKWSCAFKIFLCYLPLLRSQMRRLLSSLVDRRYLPLGWKIKSVTQLSWPWSVIRQRPLFTSHIFIVLSLDPDAKYSRPPRSSNLRSS